MAFMSILCNRWTASWCWHHQDSWWQRGLSGEPRPEAQGVYLHPAPGGVPNGQEVSIMLCCFA